MASSEPTSPAPTSVTCSSALPGEAIERPHEAVDVLVRRVKRRRRGADHVRLAEVADDAGLLQPLDPCARILVEAERELRAALLGVSRRREGHEAWRQSIEQELEVPREPIALL